MKTPKIKRDKKPFRESKFGQWLKEHDSDMFEFLANRIKGDKPVGTILKVILMALSRLTDEKKEEGTKLIDLD